MQVTCRSHAGHMQVTFTFGTAAWNRKSDIVCGVELLAVSVTVHWLGSAGLLLKENTTCSPLPSKAVIVGIASRGQSETDVHTPQHTHPNTHTPIHTPQYTPQHTHPNTRTPTHTPAHAPQHTHPNTRTPTHAHTHTTHTHTHTHTHTYIHTQLPILVSAS